MCKVFLSYARGQNEVLARRIFERLSAEGIAVWFDRESMPSRSLTFLQEIRLAVRGAQRIVVLVDQPALRSEYVKAEWQYALAAGKPVVPLLLTPTYDELPAELAGLHSPDFRPNRSFDEALVELLRILKDEVPALARWFGEVPDLPPQFQPRIHDMTRLANEVMLGRDDPVTVTRNNRVTVLHGMGGSGKSVLATAFARSTATRQAFADGVAWLSPEGDETAERLLRTFGRLLGTNSRSWQTRAECVDGLREVIENQRLLIILDNVQSISLIEPLMSSLDVDGRILVTTRLAGLAADLGARSVSLDTLEQREALQLLAGWTGCDPCDLPSEAEQVAAECGLLPFALALNGAMASRGASWPDLLAALSEHELDFAAAQERFANYPYSNVLRCIAPSVIDLQKDQPEAVARLADLVAFHWDQAVSESAVTRFWVKRGCPSPRHARQLLITLADRSLLQIDGEQPHRRIRLHDLQLDYLIATGAEPLSLSRALLETYGTKPEKDWPSVEPDGYFHRHAIRHLIELDEFEALQRLIDVEDEFGSNAWFEAAQLADNFGGYLDDLDRASEAISTAAGARKENVVLQSVHHALIRASINSLSSSLTNPMRRALLRTGIWSSDRALSEARQVADPEKRARALFGLAADFDHELRAIALDEGLSLTRTLGAEWQSLLLVVATQLAEPSERDKLMQEALTVARAIPLPGYRAEALCQVASVWPEEQRAHLLTEAFEATTHEVDTAGPGQAGFRALGMLAQLLPEPFVPQLMTLVRRIPNDFCRAAAYADVVSHVADPLIRAKLAEEGLIQESRVEGNSVWIRLVLKFQLPGINLDEVFDGVVRDDTRQVDQFVKLLPDELTEDEVAHWLSRIRSVRYGSELGRFEALFSFLNRLPETERQPLIDELAAFAPTLPYQGWRKSAYDLLSQHLDRKQLRVALRVVRELEDTHSTGHALAKLLPDLDDSERDQAVEFILERVDQSQSLEVVVTAAEAVESGLRKRLVEHALDAARAGAGFGGGTYTPDVAAETWAKLASMLDGSERVEILQYLVDSAFQWGAEQAAEGISKAADFLDDGFLDHCAETLASNAAHEAVHGRSQSIEGTQIGQAPVLARTFRVIAPWVSPERAAHLLELADQVTDPGWQMAARIALAPRLVEPARSEILDEATRIAAILDIRSTSPRENLWRPLVWLAEALPKDRRAALPELAIDAALSVGESWRASALAGVAKILSGSRRAAVVEEAIALDSPYSIPALVKFLSETRARSIALHAMSDTIARSSYPTSELSALIASGPESEATAAWHDLTSRLRNLKRADLISRHVALLPMLKAIGGPGATRFLAGSLLAATRWWR